MNLENVEAVRARIEEIEKRIASVSQTTSADVGVSKAPSFRDEMRTALRPSPMPCPEDIEAYVSSAAEKYNLAPAIIKGVIRAESGFRPNAVSRAGARGLMQLMPGTARALGVDPSDPQQNVEGGAKYLKQQIDRFGSIENALAAYNAGPGAVKRYGGVPPYAETQRYVREVMRNIESYGGIE